MSSNWETDKYSIKTKNWNLGAIPLKPSSISYDRVHFTVVAKYLKKRSIVNCLIETMGLNKDAYEILARQDKDLHLICRPSQFARFIVLRFVKYGEPNNMADLDMHLVVPPRPNIATDVSFNPNNAGASGQNTG